MLLVYPRCDSGSLGSTHLFGPELQIAQVHDGSHQGEDGLDLRATHPHTAHGAQRDIELLSIVQSVHAIAITGDTSQSISMCPGIAVLCHLQLRTR
jgi:hypothetical protein